LHGIVLRTRPAKSARKYAQIWMPEGSPLAVYTARQAKRLQEKIALPVRYAMRYGEPSILPVLGEMQEPVVLPLYPQYSESTTESVRDTLPAGVRMVEHFHDHPAYIAALAAGLRRHWKRHGKAQKLIMSFHGLPKSGAQRYEKECRETARLLAKRLRIDEYIVTFQSRFGYARWLEPHTEPTVRKLAAGGTKTVDVVCPGFVADCLETLEEIGIAARRAFHEAGGGELRLAPCLNDSPEWISAMGEIARA
jgi:ferrochelatase